jgi:hypothetical protein
MTQEITSLTSEQEALLPMYRKKWRSIAFSTQPIDRQIATDNLKYAYTQIGEGEPKIIFCDSPYAAFLEVNWLNPESQLMSLIWHIIRQISSQIAPCLYHKLNHQLVEPQKKIDYQIFQCIDRELLSVKILEKIEQNLQRGAAEFFDFGYDYCLDPTFCCHGSLCDYCLSVLNLDCDLKIKSIFYSLVNLGGWIFAHKNSCVICERPRLLSCDAQLRPHAESTPAIQFSDGFSVYAYHGERL